MIKSINWQEILFNFLGGLGLFLSIVLKTMVRCNKQQGDRLATIDKYTQSLSGLVGIARQPWPVPGIG